MGLAPKSDITRKCKFSTICLPKPLIQISSVNFSIRLGAKPTRVLSFEGELGCVTFLLNFFDEWRRRALVGAK